MEDPEDSEGGESPTDPSTGEPRGLGGEVEGRGAAALSRWPLLLGTASSVMGHGVTSLSSSPPT